MMKTVLNPDQWNRFSLSFVIIGLVVAIGIIDSLAGAKFSFKLFYLVPVALAFWHAGRNWGLATVAGCALAWFASTPAPDFGNAAVHLGFFLLIGGLLAHLRQLQDELRGYCRIDYLTKALSRGFFFDLIQMEIERLARYRHPFSIMYLDLDDFKILNDRRGHAVGDQVLCLVVSSLRQHLRATDRIARLGGDEFAILLPETSRSEAEVVTHKLREELYQSLLSGDFQTTFSVGVMTCVRTPTSVDDLVQKTDELMREVKKLGKNGICHAEYSTDPLA